MPSAENGLHLAHAVREEWVPVGRAARGGTVPATEISREAVLIGFAAEQLTGPTGLRAERWRITHLMQATARQMLMETL